MSTPSNCNETAQPRLIRFAIPIQVYGVAQSDLRDLRVIDLKGNAAPYVVDTPQEGRHEVRSFATVSDVGFVPGKYTQAVADVGRGGELHDTLFIEAPESDGDFFEWAAVDASDDGVTWRVVRDQAPIFRFLSDGLRGRQDITFPQTSARFLRVRVLEGRKAFAIGGISVARTTETKVERIPVASPALDPQSPPRMSWWTADLGVNGVPVSAVEFDATQPAFHRPVTVSASDDGKTFTEVTEGDIYRVAGTSEMVVEVPSGRGRYWRVTVFDRDDVPIKGLRIMLMATPRYVTFKQQPGSVYNLIYGNALAQAPEYDLASLTTPEERAAATIVPISSENKNEAYISPEPWTEQHAWVMWVALLAAVAIIGALALRSMKSTG